MVNRVVIVGRLTRDPELRRTYTGKAVTSFTLAFNNRMKNADGTNSSSFVNCTAWNGLAENIVNFCKKGSQVAVDGHLQERKYTRRDGTNASVVEIILDNIEFLGGKSTNANATNNSDDNGFSPDISEPQEDEKTSNGIESSDDDLPF